MRVHYGTRSMDIPFKAMLPLLGIGGLALLFSCLFCCYLYKLKQEGLKEYQIAMGYREVTFRKKKVPNELCPVCLEDFKSMERIVKCKCSHGFHARCLMQWLEESNTCPMCKAKVRQEPGERSRLVPEMAVTQHV